MLNGIINNQAYHCCYSGSGIRVDSFGIRNFTKLHMHILLEKTMSLLIRQKTIEPTISVFLMTFFIPLGGLHIQDLTGDQRMKENNAFFTISKFFYHLREIVFLLHSFSFLLFQRNIKQICFSLKLIRNHFPFHSSNIIYLHFFLLIPNVLVIFTSQILTIFRYCIFVVLMKF